MISWPRIATYISAIFVALGFLMLVWLGGYDHAKGKYMRENAALQQDIERIEDERDEALDKVEYRYIEKIKTIYVKGEEREKIREVFVPVDSGFLSPAFRVFYDAAVRDDIPDVAAITEVAPVAISTVADNVNTNYTRCHAAYARAAALENAWNKAAGVK